MGAAFVAGALAGYAIAIPVGAIAILIIEAGIRRGFRIAAAAGAGAATADFTYASVAMLGGTALAPVVEPLAVPLQLAAIVVLLFLGGRGLLQALRERTAADVPTAARDTESGLLATYFRFLGLTLLNPATIIYFAALVLALPSLADEPLARPAFVVGAWFASLSWQLVLAAVAAVAHHRLPARFQLAISVLGNLMICGFALAIAKALVVPG